MTISESDVRTFEEVTQDFRPQPTPDDCLPVALKNILDELANRHDKSELNFSESSLKDICDYKEGLGSTAENVPAILGAELEELGYTVKSQINTSIGELESLIGQGTSSYPLTELDPEYFEHIENWNPQPGRRGYSFPHIVVPFTINSEEVLYHDPFSEMMMRSGARTEAKRRMDQSTFFGLWSGNAHPRWTMWISQMEQQTLTAAVQGGE